VQGEIDRGVHAEARDGHRRSLRGRHAEPKQFGD
jgi:hypothetical protein